MPNTADIDGGIWYPEDDEAGTFAHEAGHLMGLDDQYVDWNKQPEGIWKNSENGTTLSNSEFTDLYNSRYNTHLSPDEINRSNLLCIPNAGHENDLMCDNTKPPLQSDIDNLAEQAGLIIHINAGDVLSSTNNDEQNFVVIHSGDLLVPPGESKTLNGIYTACIDLFREIPDSSTYFDIAPPLNKWDGIPASQYLLRIVKYIDSAKYYCGTFFYAQAAVWRITNNYSTFSFGDSLFKEAGIDISNQIFNFPRLTNNSKDTSSTKVYISEELFIPNVQPKFVQRDVAQSVSYNVNISKPTGYNFRTDYSLTLLDSPDGSSASISNNSIILDKKGIYNLGVNITITDSENAKRNYIDSNTAYIIVPDKFTETFENGSLKDKFPWETSANSPWKISNEEAETGSFSIHPGQLSSVDDSSLLSITVNFPLDSVVVFSMKNLSSLGSLIFYIDENISGIWFSNLFDWRVLEYNISAGEHKLTWVFRNVNVNEPSNLWIDNIFFPENSVVTSVKENEKETELLPAEFSLSQNYPNPFNSETTIKYSLAEQSLVKLTLYDALGRKIKDLFEGDQGAGFHEINFDGSSLSSGTYFYTIKVKSKEKTYKKTLKMILLR